LRDSTGGLFDPGCGPIRTSSSGPIGRTLRSCHRLQDLVFKGTPFVAFSQGAHQILKAESELYGMFFW
jgi:hypothetical protein